MRRLWEAFDSDVDRENVAFRARAPVQVIRAGPSGEEVAAYRGLYSAVCVPETATAVPDSRDFISRLDMLIAEWPGRKLLHGLRDPSKTVFRLAAGGLAALSSRTSNNCSSLSTTASGSLTASIRSRSVGWR